VAAAQPRAAVASDRIDFVDEDDARSILLALLEQVSDAARAHTHDREERHAGFTGNRTR
jgi:hypothetical protein